MYPEFRPETRKWMFWLAKTFGRRLTGNEENKEIVFYEWRGRIWCVAKTKRKLTIKEALMRAFK